MLVFLPFMLHKHIGIEAIKLEWKPVNIYATFFREGGVKFSWMLGCVVIRGKKLWSGQV